MTCNCNKYRWILLFHMDCNDGVQNNRVALQCNAIVVKCTYINKNINILSFNCVFYRPNHCDVVVTTVTPGRKLAVDLVWEDRQTCFSLLFSGITLTFNNILNTVVQPSWHLCCLFYVLSCFACVFIWDALIYKYQASTLPKGVLGLRAPTHRPDGNKWPTAFIRPPHCFFSVPFGREVALNIPLRRAANPTVPCMFCACVRCNKPP